RPPLRCERDELELAGDVLAVALRADLHVRGAAGPHRLGAVDVTPPFPTRWDLLLQVGPRAPAATRGMSYVEASRCGTSPGDAEHGERGVAVDRPYRPARAGADHGGVGEGDVRRRRPAGSARWAS